MRLLNVEEAARLLAVRPATIRDLDLATPNSGRADRARRSTARM
jgi:hypothetical protein